ncbi:unnamed protein product [Schistosoma mattheei]|uniref:Uncharacterized protein n=1 Tax=Schistosoma mattheei TaxID=31246 RepID=A0A183NYP7_9TREM|nr:unnamed protein product [Schistosoma mattheei]
MSTFITINIESSNRFQCSFRHTNRAEVQNESFEPAELHTDQCSPFVSFYNDHHK